MPSSAATRPTGDDQQRHQRRTHCQPRHRDALGHTEDPADDLGWDSALQQRPAGQVEQRTATSTTASSATAARRRRCENAVSASAAPIRITTAEDRRHQAAPPYQEPCRPRPARTPPTP